MLDAIFHHSIAWEEAYVRHHAERVAQENKHSDFSMETGALAVPGNRKTGAYSEQIQGHIRAYSGIFGHIRPLLHRNSGSRTVGKPQDRSIFSATASPIYNTNREFHGNRGSGIFGHIRPLLYRNSECRSVGKPQDQSIFSATASPIYNTRLSLEIYACSAHRSTPCRAHCPARRVMAQDTTTLQEP